MKPNKIAELGKIPRKKKKPDFDETEQEIPAPTVNNIDVKHVTENSVISQLLSKFGEHASDKDVWQQMKEVETRVIRNDYLSWKFNEFKRVLRHQGHPDNESIGFREIVSPQEEELISKYGLGCGSTIMGDIGDPQLGVYVYKHPDHINSSLHYYDNVPITIMMFKTLRGKPFTAGLGSDEMEPQSGHFCHVAAVTNDEKKCAKRCLDHRLSAVYHYEYKSDGLTTYKFPSGVLPFAVIKFNVDTVGKFRNPLGVITSKFTTFSMFPVSDSALELALPGFEKVHVSIQTPLRIAEVPNGLSDLGFIMPSNPYFPAKKLRYFPAFVALQKQRFGEIIHNVEVVLNVEDNVGNALTRFATYALLNAEQPIFKSKFRELTERLRISGVFIVALDANNVEYFIFPSGEIASSIGLPFIESVLHCISIGRRKFFSDSLNNSELMCLESRYLIEQLESRVSHELKIDDRFNDSHNKCYNYYQTEIMNDDYSPPPSSRYQAHFEPVEMEDEEFVPMPPVPLPPAGKSILYKPPPNLVVQGAPIGIKPKRRPHIRVRWTNDVIDNDNKEKNSMMLKREKEERRPFNEEDPEKTNEITNIFKEGMSKFKTNVPDANEAKKSEVVNAFGVKVDKNPKPKPNKDDILANIEEEIQGISKPTKTNFDHILKNPPSRTESSQVPISFSSIKSLPLPSRPAPVVLPFEHLVHNSPVSDDDMMDISMDDGDENEKKEEKTEGNGTVNVEETIKTVENEKELEKEVDIDESMENIEENNDPKEEEMKTKEEEVPVVQEIAPEDNDVLAFCFSSAKPVEKTPETSNSNSILPASLMNVIFSKQTLEILQAKSAAAKEKALPTPAPPLLQTKSPVPETDASKDIDLRSVQPVTFQLNKPKPATPKVVNTSSKSVFGHDDDDEEPKKEDTKPSTSSHSEKEKEKERERAKDRDRDYRKSGSSDLRDRNHRDRDSRNRDSSHHHHRSKDRDDRRDRDRDRDHRRRRSSRDRSRSPKEKEKETTKETDKDDRLKSIPMPPRVLSAEEQVKRKIDNHVQGLLRMKGKDYDAKVQETRQTHLPNFVQKNVSNFLETFGIAPSTIQAVRQASSDHLMDNSDGSSTNKNAPDCFDSPASPEPNMVVTSETNVIVPESAQIQEIEEIEEIEEPIIPVSILPIQPVVVPTEGIDGWETRFNAVDMDEEETKEIEEPPVVVKSKKPRKPIDHDKMKVSSDADDCWLSAIRKKSKKPEKTLDSDEEEGEIISDEESEPQTISDESMDITEDAVPISDGSMATAKQIPAEVIEPVQAPQDRDDRVVRRSRFDTMQPVVRGFSGPPPPLLTMGPIGQAPRPMGPPPINQMPPNTPSGWPRPLPPNMNFFNRHAPPNGISVPKPPGVPPPRFNPPGGIQPLMGSRISHIYHGPQGQQAVPFPGAGRGLLIPPVRPVPAYQRYTIVVDNMMFNRAIMNAEMFNSLCERLRQMLMRGVGTKLYVHKQIYDSLVESENETHQQYRTILMQHKDHQVFVMDEHICDRNPTRMLQDTVNCMQTMKKLHPSHEVIYLSNLSIDTDAGRRMADVQIKIYKLDQLIDLLSRM